MKKKSFTQLELLAVVICIALLGTLMLPMLGAAQEDAALVACTAQLKKITQAHQQYLNDNQKYFIPYCGVTTSKSMPTIAPCTGKAINWKREKGKMLHADPLPQQQSVFVPLAMRYMNRDFTPCYCPGDYRMTLQPCISSGASSYAYHYMALGKGASRKCPGFDTPTLDSIGEPSEVVLFGESSAGNGLIASNPEGNGWMYFRNLDTKEPAHKPHKDSYNLAFVDGHVTASAYQEILTMAFDDGM